MHLLIAHEGPLAGQRIAIEGASLILGRGDLAGLDPRQPDQVLRALNRAFPMEEHGGLFLTLTCWYGVLEVPSGELVFASVGHPPALHLPAAGAPEPLGTGGLPTGLLEACPVAAARTRLAPASELWLSSDAAYEGPGPDGAPASGSAAARASARWAIPL